MSLTARSLLRTLSVVAIAFALATVLAAQSDSGTSGKVTEATKKTPAKKLRYVVVPPPANFSPPAIAIPEATYDWGEVLQGEVVEHTFTIENRGGAPLRIERVKASCGCTAVDFDKEIPPNGKGGITLRVDTARFSGRIQKTAQVFTNASRTPEKLTITGSIKPAVQLEPKIPRMDVIQGADPQPLTITLTKASDQPIRVAEATPKTEVVEVAVKEVNPGNVYHLEVTPKLPDDTRRYHYAQIDTKIQVGEKTLTLPVRVSITVKQRIEASPLSAYFTTRDTAKLKEDGTPVEKVIDIKSLVPGHTFHVTKVESESPTPFFKTRLEPVVEGSHYRLHVTLDTVPDDNQRRKVERIKILTDDPKVPVLRITATASFLNPLARSQTRAGARPAQSVIPNPLSKKKTSPGTVPLPKTPSGNTNTKSEK